MVGNLTDVITAKFQGGIFRGYHFTGGGSRISHFPIEFCMDLTIVQRYCAAYDACNTWSTALDGNMNGTNDQGKPARYYCHTVSLILQWVALARCNVG